MNTTLTHTIVKLSFVAVALSGSLALAQEVKPQDSTPAPSKQLRPGASWTNSLGMRFVAVAGTEALFCVWETRVKDYRAFVEDRANNNSYDYRDGMEPFVLKADGWKQRGWDYGWNNPGFAQTGDHPVTCVSHQDAKAFCGWLTRKERGEGKISASQSYRLPMDWEWSVAVGLNEPRSGTAEDKEEKIKGVYPWGTEWPPPPRAGNYAGEEWRTPETPSGWNVIQSYRDGFARTSPVGSFPANRLGLHDLGGNVWEWCEDSYDGRGRGRVLRGASWSNPRARHLLSSYRFYSPPDNRNDYFGFRCVLVAGFAAR
jgi:formylglycine-generating enzyme required for sulfatase activity